MSNELKRAIVQLQVTALEKVGSRQGAIVDRAVLEEAIARDGIIVAYRTIHRPFRSAMRPVPVPLRTPESRQPQQMTGPPSLLKRLAQRWFGLP